MLILSHEEIKKLSDGKKVVLVGHSLGGSIVSRVANLRNIIIPIHAVIVMDVAESTVLDSLDSMKAFIESWPTQFPSVETAIDWSVHVGRPHNRSSAEITIPPLLIRDVTHDNSANETVDRFQWRTNVTAMSSYWKDWFQGFDEIFLATTTPHILIISDHALLDKTLLIARMQGRCEVSVVTDPHAGHFFQEDCPDETVAIWMRFLRVHNLINEAQISEAYRTTALSVTATRQILRS